jgi:hypothetical protein
MINIEMKRNLLKIVEYTVQVIKYFDLVTTHLHVSYVSHSIPGYFISVLSWLSLRNELSHLWLHLVLKLQSSNILILQDMA